MPSRCGAESRCVHESSDTRCTAHTYVHSISRSLVALDVVCGRRQLAGRGEAECKQTYSGLLAQSELHDLGYESAFTSEARVYQDGLQNTDGLEDRTFCVRLAAKPSYWGKERTYPWGVVQDRGWQPMGLSDQPPFLLVFRARSKVRLCYPACIKPIGTGSPRGVDAKARASPC